MDIISAIIGKNKAIKELIDESQIGSKHIMSDYVISRTLSFEPMDDLGGMFACIYPQAFGQFDDIRWDVRWDDKRYDCVCNGSATVLTIGNASLIEPEADDTGEPFYILIDYSQNMTVIVTNQTESSHKLTGSLRYFYLYRHIRDDYFYGTTLPVVEIPTLLAMGSGGETPLNVGTQMFNADVKGKPIVCRFNFGDNHYYTAVSVREVVDGKSYHTFTIPRIESGVAKINLIKLYSNENGWWATVEQFRY